MFAIRAQTSYNVEQMELVMSDSESEGKWDREQQEKLLTTAAMAMTIAKHERCR